MLYKQVETLTPAVPWGESIPEEHQQEIINLLLEHDPDGEEIIGCGVKTITIENTDFNASGFLVQRMDGSLFLFSYNDPFVVDSKIKSIQRTLRETVNNDIKIKLTNYFRGNDKAECQLKLRNCKNEISIDECHAHHTPPFSYLVEEFLRFLNLRLLDIRIKQRDIKVRSDGTIYIGPKKLDDDELFNNWIKFHKEHANIIGVCEFCNLSQGSKLQERN